MSPPPSREELNRLTKVPLFNNLNFAEVEKVARIAQRRRFEAGSFIFQQEDPAETLYVLLEGQIRLSQVTQDGQQVILHYVTPGEAFAVVSVLSEALYPVSAQVMEDSLTFSWNQKTMQGLMEEIPAIGINALRILAGRVREFQDRIRELSTERVERRIARALLRLASQVGRKVEAGVLIDLPLSRQDLAEMTGTTLYTVSRTLSKWESQGLIKSGREQVIICFPHGLVSIAEDLPSK